MDEGSNTEATGGSSNGAHQDDVASEQESGAPELEWVPEGPTYPLNSKRITGEQLQRIAESLGLPSTGTVAVTRQIIEGKLLELEKEPRNAQVVVQESSEDPTIFLIDEEGIICISKPREQITHVSEPTGSESGAPQEIMRSALRDTVGDDDQSELQKALQAREQELHETRERLHEAEQALDDATKRCQQLEGELVGAKAAVEKEKRKVKKIWREKCEMQLFNEDALDEKDAEIATLKARLLNCTLPPTSSRAKYDQLKSATGDADHKMEEHRSALQLPHRRGKAPPIDPFSAEELDEHWDEWLPTFERAADWNGWSDAERLLQLAGHLRGKARQEFSLLTPDEKSTFIKAKVAMSSRLDIGSKALAAQDFRHSTQGAQETVSDYILRLEKTFRRAYGRDPMAEETRKALLYAQLQEGLRYGLMKAPAVSGAQEYKELCVAAKNEERRLNELMKRQHYSRDSKVETVTDSSYRKQERFGRTFNVPQGRSGDNRENTSSRTIQKRCYICNSANHLAHQCKAPKTESTGKSQKLPAAKQVTIKTGDTEEEVVNPIDLLLSDTEDDGVYQIRVTDRGSEARSVKVDVQGVPAYGIVDSAADITIMGGKLFKQVASVARLRKKDFKAADKTPCTYNRQPFHLDGRMDLDIVFGDKTMRTPVYIKMDAPDELLLSEGVCRQLDIVTYHKDVCPRKVDRKGKDEKKVKTVRVNMVQTVRFLPHQSLAVPVKIDRKEKGTLLVEPDNDLEAVTGLQVEDTLIRLTEEGLAHVVLSNMTGCSSCIQAGTMIGEAAEVDVVKGDDPTLINSFCIGTPSIKSGDERTVIRNIMSASDREKKLQELVGKPRLLDEGQTKELLSLITNHHAAFCLDDQERGETNLVEMEIHTGEEAPRRAAARRMPFAVRQEVARQLRTMQEAGVIEPSNSPWSSPVVMVRKKDGSLRFCVDYRELNKVTRKDTYPLPRVDDLLDQIGQSKFFTTLDLASGYWQIRVEPDSQEKTAFVTPHGLFQFRVMPFGLTNAPAVFQRLMQSVLMGLNPTDGNQFVSVYIDDVLIYSRTLPEHLEHLKLVIERIEQAGLKLKPSKCSFVREEVEYLGHVLTPDGLKTNPRTVEAVREYPQPQNVKEVRQFLGLSSYYRRFIRNFAALAQPLTALTRNSVIFEWTAECQEAFDSLKECLISAPVLCYPSFDVPFVLETDASIKGIGAILSQVQNSGRCHPVAYASRSLTAAERNYGISELETLAVVWSITHFHSYLYGHRVTVFTDHSAVHAILNTPTPSGKHARWWSRVYGSGVSEVDIVYRSGKTNVNADALSRNPCAPAPQEGIGECEVQVAIVTGGPSTDIGTLLQSSPVDSAPISFGDEQRKDADLNELICFLETEELPEDNRRAKKVATQRSLFAIIEDVLYYVDTKRGYQKRIVVPKHLREQILKETHRGLMSGHFSGRRTFGALAKHWWWESMYVDTLKYVESCPECTISTGRGRQTKPPLHPIPVSRPFQVVGADLMELPKTRRNNRYVLVLQDYLTKWPLAYPLPDQKTESIARILVEDVIPFFGVPEALLTDRGTNLLSHLMRDLCELLGITKLNTTAYHPECDGMVERFNRTLKAMLRKHATRFENQWDQYLSNVLWAYRNTPHESTGEKPSFLLFGWDLRTPTEAAFLKPSELLPSTAEHYREEVMLSLSSARQLAVESIRKAQKHYKECYDRRTKQVDYQVGDWVFIKFPAEETGRNRKLSNPWHGPYRIMSRKDPDVTAVKVYFPQDGQIQVHQQRVTRCPPQLIVGYYWYGPKKHSDGKVPQWIERLTKENESPTEISVTDTDAVGHDSEESLSEPVDDTDNESELEDNPRREVTEATGLVPVRQRVPHENCPYTLRKRINTPKRYQQARDDL